MTSDRDHRWIDGRRNGIKWAVRFLHERAQEMGDPKAADILNAAAFNMGVEAKATDTDARRYQQGAKVLVTLRDSDAIPARVLFDGGKRIAVIYANDTAQDVLRRYVRPAPEQAQ